MLEELKAMGYLVRNVEMEMDDQVRSLPKASTVQNNLMAQCKWYVTCLFSPTTITSGMLEP